MSKFVLLLAALFVPALAFRVRKQNRTSAAGGKVVTLGDSYSSGCGIHKSPNDYEGGDCMRDHKTIPGAKYTKANGGQGINAACAGGQLPDAIQQFSDLQAANKNDAASGWEGSVLFFTIGGNDIRSNKGENWPGILTSCILSFYGDCHKKAENQVGNFDELQAKLGQFYDTVAKGANKATIRILGYPRLLTRSWHCIPVPGLDLDAADWADDMVDELNARISQAVMQARNNNKGVDIRFVDVKNHLTKGACTMGSNEVHSLVLDGLSISPMTFHPSQRGYDKYYAALSGSLGRRLPTQRVAAASSEEPWEVQKIMDGWDTDSNGQLCIGEVLSMGGVQASVKVSKRLRMLFGEADKDQDGSLNQAEFHNFLASVGTEPDAL